MCASDSGIEPEKGEIMGNRLWRRDGGVHDAGDVFGDVQVGRAFAVRYVLDGAPRARIEITFGVVGQLDDKDVYFRSDTRYAPTSRLELQLLDTAGEDVVESHESDGHAWLHDYATVAEAFRTVHETIAADYGPESTFTITEMFDGKELPNES